MLTKYFEEFDKKIVTKEKAAIKKTASKSTKKKTGKKTAKKAAPKTKKIKFNTKLFADNLNRIIPSHLSARDVKPVDSSGFSPEGADLIIYKEYCRDIVEIMNGCIPFELVYGAIHIEPELTKKSLQETIERVLSVKKLNRYTETFDENESYPIPSFVISADTDFTIGEIKNSLINYYMAKSIDNRLEVDILVVMNKGIIVKDWKEKRSYIGLETNEDTMYWFFILMNEYLDIEKKIELDFRNYITKNVTYNQY
jgi:uncharacterized protein YdhG (YjbR/CyaY superfamily)